MFIKFFSDKSNWTLNSIDSINKNAQIKETLKKPIEDLEILFNKLKKDKKFIAERDKYFKNWIGAPTRFIKLENLTEYVGGAQIWSKVVSDANGGAHKIYNATVHCLIAKKAGKKYS